MNRKTSGEERMGKELTIQKEQRMENGEQRRRERTKH
jgi:hypothetical protein